MGSANKMEVHLRIANEMGYADVTELIREYNIAGTQLNRLISSWQEAGRISNKRPATSDHRP